MPHKIRQTLFIYFLVKKNINNFNAFELHEPTYGFSFVSLQVQQGFNKIKKMR